MNPHSEVHVRENGKPNSLNEVHNGDVAEEMDSFTGLVEESFHASTNHAGQKLNDIFQLKQGYCADLPAIKISDLLRLNSLENASIPSLFSIVNKILDENIEKKNGDLSQRVTSLLRKVVQEIERRTSSQEKKFKNQNNLCKAREEKHQSRLRVLETLATGTTMENEIVMERLRQIKIEKAKIEEKKKLDEQDVVRLRKEKDWSDTQISALKEELDLARKTYEKHCLKLEREAKGNKFELEKNLAQLGCLLTDSRKKLKELEAFSESKSLKWKKKELSYKNFIDFQVGSLQNLRVASESIKQEVLKTQRMYSEEFNHLGSKLKELIKAAENYHMVLAENRKLYNEVQDLKGNIRVYCRIRPFLPGQNGKQTAIEYIGEDGELIVANLSKQGKDSRRLFKFNKVFGPAATQEEVFVDTQPLIRSVLDGYHVCIFAYGQTGSGKTYTMTGPTVSSKGDWGVNYRALNDLFHISELRKSSITYEVSVQMVEIYNEQVRDLLSSNSSQKRLGIWNTAQPNGLAVPDASMHPVKSTADVLELMNIGLMNRAVGATALNERSSRSHSVVTVHVRGMDLETGDVLRGSLHLVDLAGSERVDRSEATGDRLREAQHINKSLSALGDVIFALAQKSHYVPYRNSKLTQILQSSLGGQAKTLMFVQLNPDAGSYSETLSTLKFAERVSGVELGAAQSNKEGRGIRELMEEVASLKDGIAKRDEEIGRLRQTKTSANGDKCGVSLPRFGPPSPSSPRRHSLGSPKQNRTSSGTKSGAAEKAAPDLDSISEHCDKHSEADSQQSVEDLRHHKEFFRQSRVAAVDGGQTFTEGIESKNVSVNGSQNCIEDIDILGFGIADSEERLSDISDSGLSMGTETDGSNSIVEYILFPESTEENKNKRSIPTKLPRPPKKQGLNRSRLSSTKTSLRVPSSSRKPTASILSPMRPVKRWQ